MGSSENDDKVNPFSDVSGEVTGDSNSAVWKELSAFVAGGFLWPFRGSHSDLDQWSPLMRQALSLKMETWILIHHNSIPHKNNLLCN